MNAYGEIVKEITTPLGIIRLYDDGVIRAENHTDVVYTLEKCKASVKIELEEFKEETYPWIINTRNLGKLPDECQEYLRKGDSIKSHSCTAIITNGSKVERSIVNFFMMMQEISGYAVPTKLFDTVEDAEKWVQKLKKKS